MENQRLTISDQHTALFVAPTRLGKTHTALDLLEKEYKKYFNFIIIIFTTLQYNKMYCRWKWFWTGPNVISRTR